MKRKNKRHTSPEKSPEKPSRRSNRHSKRRRKSSSSSPSPEREKVHSKTKEAVAAAVKDDSVVAQLNEKVRSYTPDLVTEKINKEVVDQEAGSSRRISKRHTTGNEPADNTSTSDNMAQIVKKDEGGGDDNSEWKEDKSFWEGDPKVEESADNKGKEKDSGSVWKVQSANGAGGGEIQKLKICRQRMADSQSDESPSSPKRRSSRIKDIKNPDEVSSENEEHSNAESTGTEKSLKRKIRTRTSSRNSPAMLDSPKVVCDVSEDNPTRIKIHIENKSSQDVAGVVCSEVQEEEVTVEAVSKSEDKEAEEKNESHRETDNEKKENDGKESEEKVEENVQEEKLPLEDNEVTPKKEVEQDNVFVVDASEILTEIILPTEVTVVVEENEANKESSAKEESEEVLVAQKIPTPRRSSSSQCPSPGHESSSTTGSSDDTESNESDADGKEVRKKTRRKDGIQSTVTRQPRAATVTPPPAAECSGEDEKGKQVPEEGELEEGEAVEDEGPVESKSTPVASDKENSAAVVTQPSSVSGTSEPVQRKRRWGASKTIRPPKKPVLCISTDSLKNLIPEAKPVSIEEVRLSVDEDCDKDSDREEREKSSEVKEINEDETKVKRDKKEAKRDKGKDRERDRDREKERERDRHRAEKEVKEEKKVKEKKELTKIIAIDKPPASTEKVSRRICVLSEDARKLVRSPSPARHRPSSVLFITNLVRPFTVQQLRNLLARTGKIAENGFWIDKIKSKCYVQYTDEEAAIETRHALHGVRWPVSNPRTLCVEFASYDDMAVAQALSEETEPIPRKAEPLQVDHSVDGWLTDQRIGIDRSQRRVVREWDVGKPAHPDEELDMRPSRPDYDDISRDRERERERERDRRSKKERHRSRTPDIHEPPPRKPRRKDEDAPAKLLDDLFRKTKTSPCIYWLPLTAEQIVVKEEMRRQHMAEHERRVAEMKKAEQARRDRERRRK